MNEMTTFSWSFEEDVKQFSQAGYSGIGVWRQKLADYGEEAGVQLLLSSGLRVSNLLWAGGFTGRNSCSHEESIEDALEAIRLACCLDADCLVLYTGSRFGHTLSHAERMVKRALKTLLPEAEAMQVTLAIEPMLPACAGEWTFLNSLDQTLALIDSLAHDRLKLVFDTYQLQQNVDLQKIESIAKKVAVVHLGDSKQLPGSEQNRCLLGQGKVPNADIIQALNAGGYQGFFDVELIGEDIEARSYQEVLDATKLAWEQLLPTS